MWPRRVYTRRKRAGLRLNLTPAPGPAHPVKTEAPPGAKAKGKERGLQKIVEKEALSPLPGGGPGLPSTHSKFTGEKSLQESNSGKEIPDEKMTPLHESVANDFEIDSCSSNSDLVSGLSLQRSIPSSLLSRSITESYAADKNSEENISSFSSPELFRGADYGDREWPKLEEHAHYKNSTLLDTSNAVAIEKAPHFPNVSAILSSVLTKQSFKLPEDDSSEEHRLSAFSPSPDVLAEQGVDWEQSWRSTHSEALAARDLSASSENHEKCHRKIMVVLEEKNISPKPKCTSNLTADNATCEIVLAGKTCPSVTKLTKKNSEKDYKDGDPSVQAKSSSDHLKITVPFSPCRLSVESNEDNSVSQTLQPQVPDPVLKKGSSVPDKKSKGLLTSTPSSETADFVIDLSPVQGASFEELFPNVSNYVNSNEIVPVTDWQENSSNEFPSNPSEICCIIRASPGTREMKSKGITVKNYSPPEDIPQDILMKTNGRT